jgi:tRNA-Thr(GGU) m(6)t(6)A37 methyltransferase TsaA
VIITPIAYIRTDFSEKFGIPRQSGLADSLRGTIVFEPEYRNPDAFRGLEGFSHLWLIWEFSANSGKSEWQPTVRPPRLGGNERMGVFATRSPFRPNPLGLSCVEIDRIDQDSPDGPVIHVKGADLMDMTPIYDIKPYVKYADARPHASCGYVDSLQDKRLKVVIPEELSEKIEDKSVLKPLVQTLALDPRPSYHDDAERVYGLSFAGLNVRFIVDTGVLTVIDIN